MRSAETVDMEDLSLKNHLSGLRRKLVKVAFHTVQGLMDVKRELQGAVQRNRARARAEERCDALGWLGSTATCPPWQGRGGAR